MNPFRIPYYHLYLLQLENYHLARFARAILKRPFPPHELRQKIVWTAKIKSVVVLTVITSIMPISIGFMLHDILTGITIIIISIILFPAYLILATLILWPLDYLIKKMIIAQARTRLAQFPHLKIIAIAGSYGKTTMKEMVAAIAEKHYAVLKTPDNINTPIGIARLVRKKLTPDIQIFIVEMGAYQRGDIKTLCALTPPDIAVVTGINEAHVERFGSKENTSAAKFEIVDYAKKDALIVLNEDNELIIKNYKKHIAGRATAFYNAHTGAALPPLQLLGEYARGTARGALLIGERLGIPREQSACALAMIKPLPHRLQPIIAPGNILIIDDSYNGNPDGAREAIQVLRQYADRRKIYITPGLVEMGKQNKIIHETLGYELARVADLVILIKNSATVHLRAGLCAALFPHKQIREFKNALEAHRALSSILQSGDVILFQNDWPDNYN